jgi:predicted nucleic acid-binding protein
MPASGATRIPDANVWLAIAFSDHVHHGHACAWFEKQAESSCAFTRITQLALLRHLTNSSIMGKFVQSQQQAWQTWDQLLNDPRVTFEIEPIQNRSNLSDANSSEHAFARDVD